MKKNLRGPEPPLPRARILGGAVKRKWKKKKEEKRRGATARTSSFTYQEYFFSLKRERER
jgi:hypothetical protein